jgi:riboflavin transporter FmnP
MPVHAMRFKSAVVIANTSVFSALAIVLNFMNTEVPFPLLPYLKFDLAEIPVMVLLFLMGPWPSLLAEVIGWIALSIARGWVLGPAMKLLAVIPTILGYWIGVKASARFFGKQKVGAAFAFGSVAGAVSRIAVTSVMNIIVLLLIAPDFLKFAGTMLGVIGLVVSSTSGVLLWTLLLTAVFNGLQVLISAIPALAVIRGAAFKIPWVTQNAWILEPSK